jgi:NAD(P)-dependent dehydrogenase (short-subunit alcohol dehydrogenase family)
MVCRDRERGEQARRAVAAASGHDRIDLHIVDVSDLGAVRAFAACFADRYDRLDVLINNAGILLWTRQYSEGGIEATFATNVLGGFLLTSLLIPKLARAAPSRIIDVSSGSIYWAKLDVDSLVTASEGPYDGALKYVQTKRAQAVLSALWAERLAGSGITSNCMHPGLAKTPGVARTFPRYYRWLGGLLRDADQGADTMIWLAVSDAVRHETGKFWFDREPHPTHIVPWTQCSRADAERLFRVCSTLTDCEPPLPIATEVPSHDR